MNVTVNQGVRCVHDGTAYTGEDADVPDEVGRVWVERGWASEITEPEPKAPAEPEPRTTAAPGRRITR
jgi:hypothetical protein